MDGEKDHVHSDGRRRLLAHSLAVVVAAAACLAGGGVAMSEAMGQPPLQVSCRAEGDKAVVPQGLCELFAERVQAAANRAVEVVPETADAALVLVVLAAGPQAMTARIDARGSPGEPRAMAIRDAPMNAPLQASFLDGLLSLTPLP